MTYPKPLMSITELVEMGYSRDTLNDYSRVKDAPIIWTRGGGKILFQTEYLDDFIATVERRRLNKRRRWMKYA